MHRKIGIYRNYSHPDLIGYLDPGFIPLDWTHNPYPQIREVAIHHDFGQREAYREHHLSGVLSPKFFSKTKMRAARAHDWIEANPGYEIYLISGGPFMPYVAFNSIERGCAIHGDEFESRARLVYSALGVELPERLGRQTARNLAYTSAFVATQDFWRTWTREILEPLRVMETGNPDVAHAAYSLTPYFSPTPAYWVAFLYERLISYFIQLRGIKALFYPWTADEILGLNFQPHFVPYLRRMIPLVDRIDARSAWTDEQRDWLKSEWLETHRQGRGFEMITSDPLNFDRPALRPTHEP